MKEARPAGFQCSLMSSALCASKNDLCRMTAAELFDVYDGTLGQILLLTPMLLQAASTTVRQIRCLSSWFDKDCGQARRKSMLFERRYRQSNSDQDRNTWITQVRAMHSLYQQKNTYWSTRIASNAGNLRKMWRSLASTCPETQQRCIIAISVNHCSTTLGLLR